MRNFLFLILVTFLFGSCENYAEPAVNYRNLPTELEGLKIYPVRISDSEIIYVGVMEGMRVTNVSTTGKHPEHTILIGDTIRTENHRVVNASKILMENDTMMVLKK